MDTRLGAVEVKVVTCDATSNVQTSQESMGSNTISPGCLYNIIGLPPYLLVQVVGGVCREVQLVG